MKKDITPINSNNIEVQFNAAYPDSGPRIVDVIIDELSANTNQTRFKYDNFENDLSEEDDEALEELAASIQEYGLQQPIGVHKKLTKIYEKVKEGEEGEEGKKLKKITKWEVIFGHRRVFACKKLGLKTIKAIIYPDKDMENIQKGDFNIEKSFMFNIIENLNRENLSLIEEATIYQKIKEQSEKTQNARVSYENVAKLLGVKPIRVYRTVKILDVLDESILEQLKNKDTKKDILFLLELGKLKELKKDQIEIWDKFQKNIINRNRAIEEIEKVLAGESLNKKSSRPKTFKGGVRFMKDNQGLKIRYDKLTRLGFEEEYELQKQLADVIVEFTAKNKRKKSQSENTNLQDLDTDDTEENE